MFDLARLRHKACSCVVSIFSFPLGILVNYKSEGLFERKDWNIMPKITYPRPCPTCRKELSKGGFYNHKKQCGTFENRYQCSLCPLSFSQRGNLSRHRRQQHSKTPLRFPCMICGNVLTSKHQRKLHMETVHVEEKPHFQCRFCNTVFTRKTHRQRHMRREHGRVCREQDANLQIHLQHLSESDEIQNEWMFVESRPVQPGEHDICPCGQTDISSYFFIENKINGNRTFVGSDCIRNIDPRVGAVIAYFKHILENNIEGIYRGQDSQGLQRFEVKSYTVLVQRLFTVQHLNPQVIQTGASTWEVKVKYLKPSLLVVGQTYFLRLKAKFRQGQLTFTAL